MQKNVRYYDRNSLLSCILKHHRERRRCLNISLGATEVYSKSEYSLLQLLSDLKVGKSQSNFLSKLFSMLIRTICFAGGTRPGLNHP